MNFGRIKDIFNTHLVESYSTGDDKGKKLYKKFINTLKENEILKTQFIVYKNLESINEMDKNEAHDYLRENVSLFEKYDKESILESNKSLLNILESEGFNTNIDTPHKELYNDIHKLIVLEKKASTLNKLQESFNKVKQFIIENKQPISLEEEVYVDKTVDPKKFLEIATQKYSEKYNEQLTEEEKVIVKTLQNGSNEEKQEMLKNYISETSKLVNKQLEDYKDNITLKETLLGVKEMIYNQYESEDLKESILKLYDLKTDLE